MIKKIVRREPGRDGRILSDHRQDGNDEVHRLYQVGEIIKKKKKLTTSRIGNLTRLVHTLLYVMTITYIHVRTLT